MSAPDSGYYLMKNPATNRGCAFTTEERAAKRLRGLMPAGVVSLDDQIAATMKRLMSIESDLERYIYFATLHDSNETLYYATLCKHTYICMPFVYTPHVGEGCQKFSLITRHQPRGLFISIEDRGNIRSILDNWPVKNIKAIVFTDGERILGLGDLGSDGMGIPVGKLALYTALAGVHPSLCLPVTLDMGTNNKDKLEDPCYLGLRQPRLAPGPEVDAFVGEFMSACQDAYGKNVLMQFEDFGNGNAFRLLHQWQGKSCTFNDDIQGTASVIVAGLYATLRVTKKKLSEQTILFLGAGEAGVGIADLIADAICDETGCTREEARHNIWLVDSKGLIVKNRSSGGLQEHKLHYAHEHAEISTPKEAINALKPSILLGVSTISKAFDEEVITTMCKNYENPVIFALSNPTSKAECTAAECYTWSNGKALFASGSPFEPVTLSDGRVLVPGQGNNSYIFPGVGLAVIASGSTRVSDKDMLVAAKALAGCLTEERLATGCLYPNLDDIREVSATVAAAVAEAAWNNGTATEPRPANILAHVKAHMYEPTYN